MKYTLNQINDLIRTFANEHLQVKGNYAFGEKEEIDNNPILNKGVLMFAMVSPSILGSQSVELNISIIVADYVHKDISNRVEVLSDTLQICTDFRAYMNSPEYEDLFTINIDSVPITPFCDRFTDDVTGWWMDFKFKIVDLKDRCAIPLE